jgi:hypothetical protein
MNKDNGRIISKKEGMRKSNVKNTISRGIFPAAAAVN